MLLKTSDIDILNASSNNNSKKVSQGNMSNHTLVNIQKHSNNIVFTITPKPKNMHVAFYLYKDDKRIDTQWYSNNFTYVFNKKKIWKG